MNRKHLQSSLQCLIGGHTDLIIYGHKSWGRTDLIKSKLDKKFGSKNYVYVNSVLVWDRNAFFSILNHELCRVIKSIQPQCNVTQSLEIKLNKDEEYYQTLDQWVKMLNYFVQELPQLFYKLQRLYILIDNVQEMMLPQSFLKLFYHSCKKSIQNFKFSFIFSASHLKGRELTNQQPFKLLISLFISKPNMKSQIIRGVQLAENWVQGIPELIKLRDAIISHLYLKFQILQSDYQRILQISKQLMTQSIDYFQGNFQNVGGFLRKQGLQSLSKPLIEHGIAKYNTKQHNNNEILGKTDVVQKKSLKLQKYPKLILTSIFLANGYAEYEDRRRFAEYRRKRAKVVKTRKLTTLGNQFKKNDALTRHNTHRINAICQSLEDQADNFFFQSKLEHHSLDYYGCFEYLKDEGKIEYFGKAQKNHWGKLVGQAKEEEVRDFVRSINLKMSQFTDLED